jgi:hypothetical protein
VAGALAISRSNENPAFSITLREAMLSGSVNATISIPVCATAFQALDHVRSGRLLQVRPQRPRHPRTEQQPQQLVGVGPRSRSSTRRPVSIRSSELVLTRSDP